MMPPAIEMRDVTVTKDGSTLLEGIDLRIDAKERVAILGPNGAGKTSLIRLVTGEWRPTTDGIHVMRLFGMDRWNIFELRERLGVVSMDLQESARRRVSLRELVLSGMFSAMELYRGRDVEPWMVERADDALGEMGLRASADTRADSVSTGELRRCLIARALAHDPEMLLLDEPMSSLDMAGRYIFDDLLESLCDRGLGMVLVTHDLRDIPPQVDRVIAVRGGRIFKDGDKSDVLTDDFLSELYGVPLSVENVEGRYDCSTWRKR